MNGSPCHFAHRICVGILGVALDDSLDDMLNSLLDGALDDALGRMLVGIAEGTNGVNDVSTCDKIRCKSTCG